MPERTNLPLLDVSPALEFSSSTPLSTRWMPLHELIAHWMDAETLLVPTPVAPILTAVGHALFALGRETRALRIYTLAWQRLQECAHAAIVPTRVQEAVRHLQEAAHHWGRAAFALDTLLPTDLDEEALARARQLSRIARTQQERLCKLIEEVRSGDAEEGSPQEQGREGSSGEKSVSSRTIGTQRGGNDE